MKSKKYFTARKTEMNFIAHIISIGLTLFLVSNNTYALQSTQNTSDTFCEYYSSTCMEELNRSDTNFNISTCHGVKKCNLTRDTPLHACQVTWMYKNVTERQQTKKFKQDLLHRSGYDVLSMGCFEQQSSQISDCMDNELCVESRTEHNVHNLRGGLLFCCCDGNMCNTNFSWIPGPTPIPPTHGQPTEIWYIVVPGIFMVLLLIGLSGWYRRKRAYEASHLPSDISNNKLVESFGDTESLLLGPLESIQLTEIKAQGRFVVWKGTKFGSCDTEVAVKIFNSCHKSAWATEKEIYKLLRVEHTNILKFIGLHITSNQNMAKEFWLITEFHEKGSLYDLLTYNLLSWKDLCNITFGIASGLNYLHDEQANCSKPAIAHRDIKSKNILIKADLTPCIADFGLALVFERGKTIGDTYPQVGTKRYMAPEVLEGAIIFSRDQFFRIDMYAFGLVLWELASRCATLWNIIEPNVSNDTHSTGNYDGKYYSNSEAPSIEVYKMPFELESGVTNPSLAQMQELVIHQRIRPQVKDSWYQHTGVRNLIRTIKECWDQEAEARISASCVMERLRIIQNDTTECLLLNANPPQNPDNKTSM